MAAEAGPTDRTDARPRRRRRLPEWTLPLLIGLVSITAGFITWRAGQLGSTAAFEDRQSVGQTLLQQERLVEARLGAAAQARSYVTYRADFAEAAVLDALADDAEAVGRSPESLREHADDLRATASALAVAGDVFSPQQRLAQTATAPTEPLPFDITDKIAQLEAEASIGFGSPGVLDPDARADQADDTRHRIRELRLATLGLLVVVLVLTAAQVSDRRLPRRLAAGLGTLAYIAITSAAMAGPY